MTTLFTNLRVRGSDMHRFHCRGIRAPNRSLTIRLGQRGETVPSYIQRRLAEQYAGARQVTLLRALYLRENIWQTAKYSRNILHLEFGPPRKARAPRSRDHSRKHRTGGDAAREPSLRTPQRGFADLLGERRQRSTGQLVSVILRCEARDLRTQTAARRNLRRLCYRARATIGHPTLFRETFTSRNAKRWRQQFLQRLETRGSPGPYWARVHTERHAANP